MIVFRPRTLAPRSYCPISHRFGCIDDADQVEIRLFKILLKINLVGLAKDLPIDVSNIIAGNIRPMLRELDADALIWRAMHASHEAFDDQPGAQIERCNPSE